MTEALTNLPGVGMSNIDVFPDINSVIQNLPPELANSIGTLITILQAVGIVFLIYLIFLIVNIVFAIRRGRMIKKTYQKVVEIEEKLDKVLGRRRESKKEEKDSGKKDKKRKKRK